MERSNTICVASNIDVLVIMLIKELKNFLDAIVVDGTNEENIFHILRIAPSKSEGEYLYLLVQLGTNPSFEVVQWLTLLEMSGEEKKYGQKVGLVHKNENWVSRGDWADVVVDRSLW